MGNGINAHKEAGLKNCFPGARKIVLFDFFILALLYLFNTFLSVRIYSDLILANFIYFACTQI